MIRRALADPEIGLIVIEINSPGGSVDSPLRYRYTAGNGHAVVLEADSLKEPEVGS